MENNDASFSKKGYYAKHREQIRNSQAQYYQANKEAIEARRRNRTKDLQEKARKYDELMKTIEV